jgi:hypothetical protein
MKKFWVLSERRRQPRWNFHLAVRELDPECHVHLGTSVSAGGIFCPHASPRHKGTVVTVEIDFSGTQPPVVVPARVARSGGGPNSMGVGFEFLVPPEPLMRFLATHAGSNA